MRCASWSPRRDNKERTIAFADKVPPNLDCGEVLASQPRDEADQRDHQPVAITDGVGHSNRDLRYRFAPVHQFLTKVDELYAGDDGTAAPTRRRCRVQLCLNTP